MAKCSIDDCDRDARTRGWCYLHYSRWWRKGDTDLHTRKYEDGASCEIAGCSRPPIARGWCGTHHSQWRRTGDPTGSKPRKQKLPLVDRFMKHVLVDEESGCWVWQAGRMPQGYGIFNARGSDLVTSGLAHRASWMLHRGPITPEILVCHSCDNPPCVNPDHLFTGSHSQNMADMAAKGRRKSPGQRSKQLVIDRDLIMAVIAWGASRSIPAGETLEETVERFVAFSQSRE